MSCGIIKIPLTGGGFTIIDEEDYPKLCSKKGELYKWVNLCPNKRSRTTYASRMAYDFFDGSKVKVRKRVLLHRILIDCPNGMVIDHINRDGLDNRKSNLRIVTHAENLLNTRKSKTKNKYKGVYFLGQKSRPYAAVFRGEYIGFFRTERQAAKAYDLQARKYGGRMVTTNKTLGLLK